MQNEHEYLRDLARQQLALSQQPIMAERKALWCALNEAKGSRPMISVEDGRCWKKMAHEPKCIDPLHREVEEQLLNQIPPGDDGRR